MWRSVNWRYHSRNLQRRDKIRAESADTEFQGGCRTLGFSCVETPEERTWTYQADTYSLDLVIPHMMFHGTPTSIEKTPRPVNRCSGRETKMHISRQLVGKN
ncbi:hypothetical protein GUJ93_ZPchr0007g5273 [Zizania palustris]|uniref:Uncharacterized protein n=1 Tax=Zizania palustris TaxID=103762 RepID=A0A8J5TEG3_ZIZPA|nr:hypothetical protein GUJ93_ZPchr0007g5273 [Zizania palustris]